MGVARSVGIARSVDAVLARMPAAAAARCDRAAILAQLDDQTLQMLLEHDEETVRAAIGLVADPAFLTMLREPAALQVNPTPAASIVIMGDVAEMVDAVLTQMPVAARAPCDRAAILAALDDLGGVEVDTLSTLLQHDFEGTRAAVGSAAHPTFLALLRDALTARQPGAKKKTSTGQARPIQDEGPAALAVTGTRRKLEPFAAAAAMAASRASASPYFWHCGSRPSSAPSPPRSTSTLTTYGPARLRQACPRRRCRLADPPPSRPPRRLRGSLPPRASACGCRASWATISR